MERETKIEIIFSKEFLFRLINKIPVKERRLTANVDKII